MAKRLDVIRRHLQPSGKRFLDCGCGAGEYVSVLAEQMGLEAYGVEFDEEKVKQAHSKPSLQARITRGDIEASQFVSDTWDYVLLNEVLEHVPDDSRALNEVYRVLKPGGRLFIFSPNRWFPFETHGIRLKHSRRRIPHWVPFIPYIPLRVGNLVFDYWARNYWQGEMVQMVEGSGFSIVERTFVWLTFEDISGGQPRLIKLAKPLLRHLSNTLEKIPGVKRFGVSQVIVCRK